MREMKSSRDTISDSPLVNSLTPKIPELTKVEDPDTRVNIPETDLTDINSLGLDITKTSNFSESIPLCMITPPTNKQPHPPGSDSSGPGSGFGGLNRGDSSGAFGGLNQELGGGGGAGLNRRSANRASLSVPALKVSAHHRRGAHSARGSLVEDEQEFTDQEYTDEYIPNKATQVSGFSIII